VNNAPPRVTEPQIVESQAMRTTIACSNVRPQLGAAHKVNWFGLRRQMLLRMAALEKTIPNLRAFTAGTDDNRALESIEPIPFCDRDIEAVEALLAVLEALPPPPTTANARAMEAATRLSSFGGRIKAQVVRQADMFVSKPSEPAGAGFGKSGIRHLLHYVFADRLLAVGQAAFDCLNWPARDLERPASWNIASDTGGKKIPLQRPAFFEEGAIGLARPTKYFTTPRPTNLLMMSRVPRARPVLP
jgi:hypothetical protein